MSVGRFCMPSSTYESEDVMDPDDSAGRADAQESIRRAAEAQRIEAIRTLGKWARGDDCKHGYYAAGGTELCPACFDDGGEYEHQHDPFTDENGKPFPEDYGDRRLIIAAYWTDEVEPFMQWDDGKRRFPDSIKGSGAVVSMTPEQVGQRGLRDTLRRLQLEEAADWSPNA